MTGNMSHPSDDSSLDTASKFHSAARGRAAEPTPSTTRDIDARLAAEARDRLSRDERLDASRIRITVLDAMMVLSGAVTSNADRRLAEEAVGSLAGVRRLLNNLMVG